MHCTVSGPKSVLCSLSRFLFERPVNLSSTTALRMLASTVFSWNRFSKHLYVKVNIYWRAPHFLKALNSLEALNSLACTTFLWNIPFSYIPLRVGFLVSGRSFSLRAQHFGSIGHFNLPLWIRLNPCPLEDLLSMEALNSLACAAFCEILLSATFHFEQGFWFQARSFSLRVRSTWAA